MKTVIVLGNARSGTSMVSGIVHSLGVNMNPVDNPSSQNPKGSFEDRFFIHWTSKLHQAHNAINDDGVQEALTKIVEGIQKRNEVGIDWGFKSALTHMVWDYLSPDMFQNPYFISNTRDPENNARSWILHMKQNYGRTVDMDEAINNINRGNKKLRQVVKSLGNQKLFKTSYEHIKSKPKKAAQQFMDFLEIEPNEVLFNKVVDFIMPGYSTLNQE